MPTIEDWFLADVLAHPESDACRLIYADWLDEQGREERAEFIRVQIELAWVGGQCPQCAAARQGLQHTNGPCRCVPERRHLRQRERQLLNDPSAVAVPWGPGAPPGTGFLAPIAWTHRRGFLASVRLGTEQWLRDGPLFVSRCPLEWVSLADRSPLDTYPHGGPTGCHLWFKRTYRWVEGNPSVADVPSQFWPHLPDGGTGTSRHRTKEAALAALSDAALAWARREGLRTRHTMTVEIDSCPTPPAPVE